MVSYFIGLNSLFFQAIKNGSIFKCIVLACIAFSPLTGAKSGETCTNYIKHIHIYVTKQYYHEHHQREDNQSVSTGYLHHTVILSM